MEHDDPATLTAEALLASYRSHALSPVEVVRAVLERVDRLNPAINAFALMVPGALEAARESEGRWAAGRPAGLLDGVPCTVKDLVDLAGFPTRRGSHLTSDEPMAEDAPLAAALKSSGAIIIGKTTTTEFGWKSPGDCPLHGVTRNPHNLAYSTGGSSSGAGAAGAACFGPLHVGTDAGGSIRIPAAWCGLVGLKPSFGRVPQWPAGAFANVSCAGPMTRTVRDAALMLSAIARHDPRDPLCLPDDPRDWRSGIEDGVAGMRVGIIANPGFAAPIDAEGAFALDDAATLLRRMGADVQLADPGLPDTSRVFGRVWGVALARLVETFPEERRPLLDPGLLQVAAAEKDLPATEFLSFEATRILTAHLMARFHQRFDLALCPTVPAGPPLAGVPTADPLRALWTEWAPWTFLFNLARQPAITVPLGPGRDGLPRSVQIAAGQYRDDLVLRAARAIEREICAQAAGTRRGQNSGEAGSGDP
ncbi:MAG: amidase [Acetobacteraceae bacterium]|nr:amidase [Acetobacteraceae bacterium]